MALRSKPLTPEVISSFVCSLLMYQSLLFLSVVLHSLFGNETYVCNTLANRNTPTTEHLIGVHTIRTAFTRRLLLNCSQKRFYTSPRLLR